MFTILPSCNNARIWPSDVCVSYPKKSVVPCLSAISNQIPSSATSPDPTQAARAFAFCSDIALLKPSTSTSIPFSRKASCVRSSGKPKVSYNLNAVFPESVAPDARTPASSSKSLRPRSNVVLKRVSSSNKLSSIKDWA